MCMNAPGHVDPYKHERVGQRQKERLDGVDEDRMEYMKRFV